MPISQTRFSRMVSFVAFRCELVGLRLKDEIRRAGKQETVRCSSSKRSNIETNELRLNRIKLEEIDDHGLVYVQRVLFPY